MKPLYQLIGYLFRPFLLHISFFFGDGFRKTTSGPLFSPWIPRPIFASPTCPPATHWVSPEPFDGILYSDQWSSFFWIPPLFRPVLPFQPFFSLGQFFAEFYFISKFLFRRTFPPDVFFSTFGPLRLIKFATPHVLPVHESFFELPKTLSSTLIPNPHVYSSPYTTVLEALAVFFSPLPEPYQLARAIPGLSKTCS